MTSFNKLYTDEIEKLNYYKNIIMKDLTRKGIYPDNVSVKEKLSNIDLKLSLFQYKNIGINNIFNVKKFNDDLIAIANDLKILYKIAYDASYNKFQEIKEYTETHIKELKVLSDKYNIRSAMELETTALGNTVFFQTSGFETILNNGFAIINLPSIEVTKGSKLACFLECDNINQEDIIFSFGLLNNCSTYLYNKDTMKIPGEKVFNIYNYLIPEDEEITSSHIMNIENLIPNNKNIYTIFAGKNKYKSENNFNDLKTNINYTIQKTDTISFYIINSSYIDFNFSEKPLETNFSGYNISAPDKCQYIIIKAQDGFSFNVNTDGEIYATKEKGYIKDNQLYYPNYDDLRTYRIEESVLTEKTTIENIKVTINNLKRDIPLVIKSITIKEIIA